jgi:hypothetical protein
MTIQKFKSSWLLWLLLLGMAACSGNEKSGVGYVPYNHTDKAIVSILINGQGGVAMSMAHGSGGEVCCVVLPVRWKSGLKASIKWQEDGEWLLDERGKEVFRNGKRVYVESEWKEKIVEIPEYATEMGLFFIHFLPGDEVKVAVSPYDPRHPKHPYRFADIPLINP